MRAIPIKFSIGLLDISISENVYLLENLVEKQIFCNIFWILIKNNYFIFILYTYLKQK